MNSAIKIVLMGALVVLGYDTAASALSQATGFTYEWFSIGSSVLYVLFGYLAARRSKWFFGGLVGAFLGLVDSTLGWAISWTIGPGKPDIEMTPVLIAFTVIFVMIVGAILGQFGGLITLFKKQNA